MIKYVAKYYYISHDSETGGVIWGGGSAPFRSGGFRRGDGFGWGDGSGFGNGDPVYYMFNFNCRRFNFWEIEITSR